METRQSKLTRFGVGTVAILIFTIMYVILILDYLVATLLPQQILEMIDCHCSRQNLSKFVSTKMALAARGTQSIAFIPSDPSIRSAEALVWSGQRPCASLTLGCAEHLCRTLEAMEASPVDESSDYGGYGSEDFEQARRGSRVSGFRVAFSDVQC